jgi:transposase-like protein
MQITTTLTTSSPSAKKARRTYSKEFKASVVEKVNKAKNIRKACQDLGVCFQNYHRWKLEAQTGVLKDTPFYKQTLPLFPENAKPVTSPTPLEELYLKLGKATFEKENITQQIATLIAAKK